jgi:hypothetical protein
MDNQNFQNIGLAEMEDDEEEDEEEEEENILDAHEMNAHPMADGEDDELLMRFCPHDSSMLYPKVRLLW